MLTTDKDKMICEKYRHRASDGYSHCYECPLRADDSRVWNYRCKANGHYNNGEWEYNVMEEYNSNE